MMPHNQDPSQSRHPPALPRALDLQAIEPAGIQELPRQGRLDHEQRGFLAYETLAKAIQDLSIGKPR